MLKVLQIVPGTSVDGPGLRTSVYLAGCRHACPGCHNPASWDSSGGTPMSVEEVMTHIRAHGFNVTLTGGDPLQHAALPAVKALIDSATAEGFTVWCYTGYTIEEIQSQPELTDVVSGCQAIVEGPFVAALRSTEIPFRGSLNQRIVRPDGTEWHR